MKTRTLGLILIIAGILTIAYSGFNYVTTKRVVDIGSLKIDKEKTHRVQWPPFLGVILLSGGIVALFTAKKNIVN